MRTLFAVFIIVFAFSCKEKKNIPADIIQPKKMQLVFWDYIRADVFAKDFAGKDSSLNDTLENIKLQNKVFSFYNISREDFYKSYNYYVDHPELMDVVMDSMIARQNRIKLHSQQQQRLNRKKLVPKDKLFKEE